MDESQILLIVEDEAELSSIIVETLADVGITALQAFDGEEALELLLNDASIRAVISDIAMPKKDGLKLLADVRQRGLDLPFVILTGHGDRQSALEAMQLGAMGFLEKPFKTDHLLKVAEQAMALGNLAKSFDTEIERLMDESGVPNAERAKYRQMQKELLLMKVNSSLLLAKKAS